MDAKVTWKDGMSFVGTAGTGYTVPLGSDPAVGGKNDGFRPLELMAVSLAGCTAMDVISILRKKQQVVTEFEVLVQASQPDTHPHVFSSAKLIYKISGHGVDETAVIRAIQLSATKYCPAQAMLSKVFPIDLVYEIHDIDSNLVKNGECKLD